MWISSQGPSYIYIYILLLFLYIYNVRRTTPVTINQKTFHTCVYEFVAPGYLLDAPPPLPKLGNGMRGETPDKRESHPSSHSPTLEGGAHPASTWCNKFINASMKRFLVNSDRGGSPKLFRETTTTRKHTQSLIIYNDFWFG